MTQDELKKQVAAAALEQVKGESIIGVGTGSTVNFFIEMLADMKNQFEGTVSSSIGTTERLEKLGIPVLDLNEVNRVSVYVDGADEVNADKRMIKGGGAALTREKIVAAASDKFICIVDQSKRVEMLGAFPLPVEVIPMSRSYVAREIAKMGGQPQWREGCVTDNGNHILDVHNLRILDPIEMEKAINDIPGVITNGLFAIRPADIVLVGEGDRVTSF